MVCEEHNPNPKYTLCQVYKVRVCPRYPRTPDYVLLVVVDECVSCRVVDICLSQFSLGSRLFFICFFSTKMDECITTVSIISMISYHCSLISVFQVLFLYIFAFCVVECPNTLNMFRLQLLCTNSRITLHLMAQHKRNAKAQMVKIFLQTSVWF